MTMMIQVENVAKTFTLHNQGGVRLPVFDNVNFSVEAGEALVLAQVAALIRRLPPVDMQVIVLWLEGESAADIAEITGLSPGAVNVRVHRIKTLLASHFQFPGTGETP